MRKQQLQEYSNRQMLLINSLRTRLREQAKLIDRLSKVTGITVTLLTGVPAQITKGTEVSVQEDVMYVLDHKKNVLAGFKYSEVRSFIIH